MLLTTAGVHLKSQPLFNVEAGDYNDLKKLPDLAKKEQLMITHTHYDTSGCE
ncbi:hypothetical protein KHA80_22790 [Anaerobacillus sp. HL2]|nr:hypothetical protein KHA80_22790 [Anaerobacillus sp. HL2]